MGELSNSILSQELNEEGRPKPPTKIRPPLFPARCQYIRHAVYSRSERDLHDNIEGVGIPEIHLDNKTARKTFYNPETNLHRSSISPLWSRARQPLDSIVIALRQIGMYLLGKFDLQDRIKALIERKEYSIKWNSVTLAMTIQMMKEIQQIFHSVAGNRDFYSRLLADLLREKRVQIGS